MGIEKLREMSAKELRARLKELNDQAATASGEALDKIVSEAETIKGLLDDASTRAKLAEMAKAAGSEDAGETGAQGGEDAGAKARKRGDDMKAGKGVRFAAARVSRQMRPMDTLTTSQTALPVHTAEDVAPTFNNVSSLVDRVHVVNLPGGETYQRGFVKDYGSGAAAKAENTDYATSEPTFGYVTIKKEKVTAYCEEPEEMVKLPSADYDAVVEDSVVRAIRRYMARNIIAGDGSTSKFCGIFYNPAQAADRVIDPATDISIAEIDDGTLDEIIYSFGGDEDVEDMACLILNKADLKAFAKLRDKQGRKIYTIVNNGNTGTIDGVPYIINSAVSALGDADTATGTYVMAYGPLSNYELAVFSDIDARKSTEYKFKAGQIAYRADIYAGGSVAAWNGFLRVKKAAKS